MAAHPKIFLFGVILLLLSSCTHYYYAPNTIPTPFLREKGDCTLHAAVGFGHEYTGSELQAVFSPVRYGALMGNFFHASGAANRANTFHDSGQGYLLEGGLGGYYPLGKTFSTSLFAGYGRGNVLNYYADGSFGAPATRTFPSKLYFDRLFVQPSITYRGKVFTLGLGFRLCQLRYIKGEIDLQAPAEEVMAVRSIEASSPIVLPELVYKMGFYIEPVTLGLHITRSYVPDPALHLNPGNFSFSAAVDIHKLWRRE